MFGWTSTHLAKLAFTATLCLIFFAASAVAQQNLLANPGFETGDFTGWTVSGTSSNYGVNVGGFLITGTYPEFGPTYVVVHSGTYAGYGVVCTLCPQYVDLSQTLTLQPGGIYAVGFWVGNGSMLTYGDSISVMVNGQGIYLSTDPGYINPGYQFAAGTFLATQYTNTVTFRIEGSGYGPAGFSFDDFSLVFQSYAPSNGGTAYVVNQAQDTVASNIINSYTGVLTSGQGSPFPTGAGPVAAAALGPFTFVADQGSSQISAYTTDNNGAMTQATGSPFPAQLVPNTVAINPAANFVYATGLDQNGNGAISGWRFDSTGALTPVPGSPFAAGSTPSALAFNRNGQYLYVADSANDQVLGFSLNQTTGALAPLPGSPFPVGSGPAALATALVGASNFEQGALYVANAGDNDISAFLIDRAGNLNAIAGSPFPAGTTPSALVFDISHNSLYSANAGSSNLSAWLISQVTGALSPIAGSPFPADANPNSLANTPTYLYANTPSGIDGYQVDSTGALSAIPGSPFAGQGTAIAAPLVFATQTPADLQSGALRSTERAVP